MDEHEAVVDLYKRVEDRLPEQKFEVTTRDLVAAVLSALADRLTPDEAANLGAELPLELGDILAHASGDGRLVREEFIEDLAARLDIDDDTAELGANAVLGAIRDFLEPLCAIDEVLETLPPDLAQMMT